jgi:hypothetical protein
MKNVVVAVVLVLVAAGAQAQASLGEAIDGFLDDAHSTLGVATRDAFVRSLVKQGFKCRGTDGPSADVMCVKGGIGQTAKFSNDGTARIRKVILDTDDDCKAALWHLEARFGKPELEDESAKGWVLSETRLLAYYYNEGRVARCDVTLSDRRPD